MRLPNRFYRFIPMLGFHHIQMIICAIAIILLSILLAGCTSSSSLSNIYLLSIKYRTTIPSPVDTNPALVNPNITHSVYNISSYSSSSNSSQNASSSQTTTTNTICEVRVGYRGLCITLNNGQRICSGAAALATMVRESKTTDDPLNLIFMAKKFMDEIVFDGLIFIAIVLTFICLLLLMTFPGWHEETDDEGSEVEVKPFPSRPVTYVALGASTLGFIFALISVLWQHVNSSAAGTMAETLTYGAVEGHVGTGTMILGWAGVALICIVALAMLVMIMSVSIIRQLDDEDEEK